MAILAECPFCHRRQTVKSKRCISRNGRGCGADLDKARRSGKVKYWIAYRLPGGKQRFEKLTGENAGSIEYAKAADAKRKVQKSENRILDIKPEAKMTFQELTDWYMGLEKVKALAYYCTLQVYLKKFNAEFGNVIVNRIKPADLENLHDLRHCFNTYMRKAGVAESVIMRMTGHSSREMFDRYNRVDEQDMKNAVAKMGTFLASVDQTVDQKAN